jgi:Xaa-Pro dipeptidase
VWFGDHLSPEFKTVYNLVHDAQTAAIQLGKPLFTPCQEMDRAARRVIAAGGFGPHFTHRLGYGIGLDGHEPPYLVEGNETRLEPGMVFTLENLGKGKGGRGKGTTEDSSSLPGFERPKLLHGER